MRISPLVRRAMLPLIVVVAAAAGAARGGAAGASDALGAWLPDPDAGFMAWSNAQTSASSLYDYFVCGNAAPAEKKQSFYYPGSACPLVKGGTSFSYGGPEPKKVNVLYDPAHAIVLYDKGCCAWRGFALTAGFARPPSPVAAMDLHAVRTMRGVSLGMSSSAVEKIYGAAKVHAAKERPGMNILSYTTMRGTPSKPAGDACGQFQSFFFQRDRLVSIELLTGC
jgi:hypothetical protein